MSTCPHWLENVRLCRSGIIWIDTVAKLSGLVRRSLTEDEVRELAAAQPGRLVEVCSR